MWRLYPWLLGLILAPLLFGSVTAEGQIVVGILLGGSLLLCAGQSGGWSRPLTKPLWLWMAGGLLLLPLLPLPMVAMNWLDPARSELARSFPVEPGLLPSWMPLSVSPAKTMQRLWELGLVLACFSLARQSVQYAPAPRLLALGIASAVCLLAASDVWYRLDGRRSVLGLWEITWGKGAGTFANRNHFANWVYMGLLFSAGWVMRGLSPLFSPRSGGQVAPNSLPDTLFLLVVLPLGLITAVASGSRAGLLALLAGLSVWLLLLKKRTRSRTRWGAIGLVAILALALAVGAGELVIDRLMEAKLGWPQFSKIDIWRQSLALFSRFVLFGTGWGTFATAFNHYKSGGGDSTVLHAENDYIQLLVETGLVGALVLGLVLSRVLRAAIQFAWREALAEPELVFGAVAGLAAFALQAVFEFVFQITATALLAAALLGFIIGSRDQARRPAVIPLPSGRRLLLNYLAAVVLLTAAVLQGAAWFHWQKAKAEKFSAAKAQHLVRSLQLWPWAVNRQITLTRTHVQVLSTQHPQDQRTLAKGFRPYLNRTLARDPYNWELRLERAWFDLAFATNSALAQAEALEVVKLNPRQPEIPLRFAAYFAERNPDRAWDFLRSVDPASPASMRRTLLLAWRISGDSAALWSLVPNTPSGLRILGDMAFERGLFPLAVQAYQRLPRHGDRVPLAEKFLQAKRPDLALALLPDAPATFDEKRLKAKAHWQMGHLMEAIRSAQSAWRSRRFATPTIAGNTALSDLESIRREWEKAPNNAGRAASLAERICREPPLARDLALLRQLSERFPDELRLRWLVFQTEFDLGHLEAAAQIAVELADRAGPP
ncbi:MAG: O-antigen ligase family protein [Chloroflexi bacterium]|nr:O-antigen ligase family protein [Chloroflexota bacterium]